MVVHYQIDNLTVEWLGELVSSIPGLPVWIVFGVGPSIVVVQKIRQNPHPAVTLHLKMVKRSVTLG